MAEQASLERTKQQVATASSLLGPPVPTAGGATVNRGSSERAQREDRALLADNVAFSRAIPPTSEANATGVTSPPAVAPVMSGPVATPLTPASAWLAPVTSNAATTPPAAMAVLAMPKTDGPAPIEATARPSANQPIPLSATDRRPAYQLLEGTVIETVLTNRLDGTFTGPVNCLVTTAVYAVDAQHLLVPAGARVLGEAKPVNTLGQSRIAVVFHRLILPNGTSIDLHEFHGLNQGGDVGLQDQVNRHYAQIFGASLAVGAIAGLAQAQTSVGVDATTLDVYRQGAAANLAQSSARILDRFLNLLPTVTIREGHRIKVYLSNDLELPAYREAVPVPGGRR